MQVEPSANGFCIEYNVTECSTPRVPVLCPTYLELGVDCVMWDCWKTDATTPLPPSTTSTTASPPTTTSSKGGDAETGQNHKVTTIVGATTAAVFLVVVASTGGILYWVKHYFNIVKFCLISKPNQAYFSVNLT